MKKEFDIAVVGAGMVGLATAALLAQSHGRQNLRITVIDAGKKPHFDVSDDVGLRVSAISQGSLGIFQKIGIWDRITALRASPYRRMRVWDSREPLVGPCTLRFDAEDFAVSELGFIVENALIQYALLMKLDELNVAVRFATPLADICRDHDGRITGVLLQDGRDMETDLLIGADGVASSVRQSAGISVSEWRYPQAALVTHVMPAQDHQQTAWQRFLPDGPLAFLPLADGRVSVVWSTTPEQAKHALSVTNAELATLLGSASEHFLGQLEVAGPRGSFPLKSQHAGTYVMPGLVLVGDAAHAVHPLAGQGANLGIADAEALVETVAAALLNGEYPGDLPTLRRYERRRKGANKTMLHFVDALNRLFLADSTAVATVRSGGMRLFNQSGPVQRRAVRVALGI
jgi:2-octaprenylphenol hydroxylase